VGWNEAGAGKGCSGFLGKGAFAQGGATSSSWKRRESRKKKRDEKKRGKSEETHERRRRERRAQTEVKKKKKKARNHQKEEGGFQKKKTWPGKKAYSQRRNCGEKATMSRFIGKKKKHVPKKNGKKKFPKGKPRIDRQKNRKIVVVGGKLPDKGGEDECRVKST